MYFDVYGPFDVAREDGVVLSKQSAMWDMVRAAARFRQYTPETALEVGIGCYTFGLSHGSTMMPWYVGMTIARAGFRGEIFQRHKRDHYNRAMAGKPKAKPIMFLMPLLTNQEHYATGRSGHESLIRWVEKMLFGAALARNPECMNKRDTKFLREVQVAGIFNSRPVGREKADVEAVRNMFGTWR